MTTAATRDAAYWRARAQEYRDDMTTFRLSPEKEEAYRAEAAFCDAVADAVDGMVGKPDRDGRERREPPRPAGGTARGRPGSAPGRRRSRDPDWVDAAGVGV